MDFPQEKVKDAVDAYVLEQVLIETDRMPVKVDVQNVTTDLDIYEHIDKPYLTASLIFNDSQGIFVGMDFIGAERVTIRIKSTQKEATAINKVFYVVNVMNTQKVNDNNEVIGLNLIEDIGYYSNLININRSYTGKCSTIIKSILSQYFGKEIEQHGLDYQQKFKVIIPNLNPIEAMAWIKNKATDTEGFPFFLYSTLVGDKIQFVSLFEMLDQTPMNPSLPFVYWQSASTSKDRDIQSRTILAYEYANADNLFELIKGGVVGADYMYIDTLNGRQKQFAFDVDKDAFDPLLSKKATNAKVKSLPYDNKLKFNDVSFSQLQSRAITQIGGTGSYNQAASIYPGYSEEDTNAGYKKKVVSRSLLKFLTKSPLNILVVGNDFIKGNNSTTIGNKLSIEFINSTEHSRSEDKKDPKRSGDYLIYSSRHMFKKERYDLSLSCVKIGNNK